MRIQRFPGRKSIFQAISSGEAMLVKVRAFAGFREILGKEQRAGCKRGLDGCRSIE